MKFTTTIPSTFVILAVIILAFAGATQAQGWYESCQHQYTIYFPSILQAFCYSSDQVLTESNLDIDQCIANYGGQLKCSDNGGFSSSCYDCSIVLDGNGKTTSSLQCICYTGNGIARAKIDLDSCISNWNGILGCFDHHGIHL